MIQDRFFKTGATEQRPGRLMVSDKTADYDVLLMFNHGVGEAGDGTLTNLPRLWGNSVASGPLGFPTNDFIYKHPIDGKTYRFIIVAMQGIKMDTDFHWCCFPWQIKYAIENDIKPLYPKIKSVFITGLSAGGGETINSISDAAYADLYTAAVPMSAASGGVDASVTAKKNIAVWSFCGDNDWAYRPNVENFAKAVNAIKPGLAKVTLYPGGHGDWNLKYDPSYKENGQNIYEWMLSQYKPLVLPKPIDPLIITPPSGSDSGIVLDKLPDPVIVKTPVIPVIVKAPDPVILPEPVAKVNKPKFEVMFGYSDVLYGTQSTGVDLKYQWSKVSGGRINFVTPNSSGTWINSLEVGEYVLRLTVTDSAGQSNSVDFPLTVKGALVPKTLKHYLVTAVYSDGSKDVEKIVLPANITLK